MLISAGLVSPVILPIVAYLPLADWPFARSIRARTSSRPNVSGRIGLTSERSGRISARRSRYVRKASKKSPFHAIYKGSRPVTSLSLKPKRKWRSHLIARISQCSPQFGDKEDTHAKHYAVETAQQVEGHFGGFWQALGHNSRCPSPIRSRNFEETTSVPFSSLPVQIQEQNPEEEEEEEEMDESYEPSRAFYISILCICLEIKQRQTSAGEESPPRWASRAVLSSRRLGTTSSASLIMKPTALLQLVLAAAAVTTVAAFRPLSGEIS
eukprot:scaffold146_cov265-Pinguiococcus_pyrenoidosus.AAC.22